MIKIQTNNKDFEIINLVIYTKGGMPLFYVNKKNYNFIQGTTGFLKAMWAFLDRPELNGNVKLKPESFINIYPEEYVLIHKQYKMFYIVVYFRIKKENTGLFDKIDKNLLNKLISTTKELGDEFKRIYQDKLTTLINSTKEFENFSDSLKVFLKNHHINIPNL